MAVVTATALTSKIPAGPHWMQVFSANGGAGAADEWIETGFGEILAAFIVTTGDTVDTHNVLVNAQGTGAAQTSGGSVGFETVAGEAVAILVIGD